MSDKMFESARPYTRWWWFSGILSKKIIKEQLVWLKLNGFGGVEIAWVYAQPEHKNEKGFMYLSEEWLDMVNTAITVCNDLGLGCDVTYGTLWPFGGSFVPDKYASRTIDGLSTQRLIKSWESRYLDKPGNVVNHLDKESIDFYMDYLYQHGFKGFAQRGVGAFFCDSLELDMEEAGYCGIEEDFEKDYKRDLIKERDKIKTDPDFRYSYRMEICKKFLSDFFETYNASCHKKGVMSRLQCHGAMVDLMAAYSRVDIPESESILFDPSFSLIPVSAAAFSGKKIISSETFTCLYGWVTAPLDCPHIREEKIQDLKCLADSQFAFGINQIVWHGMPYNAQGGNKFYASVHVGPGGNLEKDMPRFNGYLEKVSSFLRMGKVYSKLGVYFPLEDQLMKDRVPKELEKPSNFFYWECQEITIEDELLPYRPLLCGKENLEKVEVLKNGRIKIGDIEMDALLFDSEYVDYDTLKTVKKIQEKGGNIIFKKEATEPGLAKHDNYASLFSELYSKGKTLDVCSTVLQTSIPVNYWIKEEEGKYNIFVSHPQNRGLSYPLKYEFYKTLTPCSVQSVFTTKQGRKIEFTMNFTEDSSLMLVVDENGKVNSVQLP